jgi:hypothetical protein
MMSPLWGFFYLAGFYPLALAWRANRETTLRQALAWAAGAWALWTALAWGSLPWPGHEERLACYAALCLTACAGVAVLGARRPGVGPWNFVVLGLLAVLLRPLAEGFGELRLTTPHLVLLAAPLTVALLNYLPTRLGPAALLLAAGCAVEVAWLAGGSLDGRVVTAGRVLLAAAPWAGWAGLRGRAGRRTEFDALWLAYRDRFGLVWAQRMREQFNRAAANAGWGIFLSWQGLRATEHGSPPDPTQALAALRAVLKRFGPERDTAT